MQRSDTEVLELRQRIARLMREARHNEAAWKENQRYQLRLLDAGSVVELLRRLTSGIQTHFRLDMSTLLLADPDHEIRHLLIDQGGGLDTLPDVVFCDSMHAVAPQLASTPRPWLGRFSRADHGLLFRRGNEPASVALLPLTRQGTLFGSVNLGSLVPNRFTTAHASDFLEHLAAIAAYCIENTVNRARLIRSGFRDILTGWYNRRYLMSRLAEEIARSNREGTPLVCLMIDVDHFKPINDTYGHLAGDAVLRQLARCIDDEVRRTDVSARFGGEEFVILLPRTQVDAGLALAERVRAAVAAEPFSLDAAGAPVAMTVSIGIAEHVPGARNEDVKNAGERLIAAADLALYDAKAAGRNRVVRGERGAASARPTGSGLLGC